MRQVIIFEQRSVPDDVYGGQRVVKTEKARAIFHRWGMHLRQTAAIVELNDGAVEYVAPDMIKFVDPIVLRVHNQTAVPANLEAA